MLITNTELARFLILKSALKLEVKGLKCAGKSAYSKIKSEYNLKGSRQNVLDQMEGMK